MRRRSTAASGGTGTTNARINCPPDEHYPLPITTEPFPSSTCCIKDVIGTREISWTLRGDDEAVSRRVQRVLSFLDKLKGHMSKPEPAKKNDRDAHKL